MCNKRVQDSGRCNSRVERGWNSGISQSRRFDVFYRCVDNDRVSALRACCICCRATRSGSSVCSLERGRLERGSLQRAAPLRGAKRLARFGAPERRPAGGRSSPPRGWEREGCDFVCSSSSARLGVPKTATNFGACMYCTPAGPRPCDSEGSTCAEVKRASSAQALRLPARSSCRNDTRRPPPLAWPSHLASGVKKKN